MALVKHKKISTEGQIEGFKNSPYNSRNCSPTANTIKNSLISALKHYTKTSASPLLSKPDLIILLKQLHFLQPGSLSPEDHKNISYMWNLTSKNSTTTIFDAISYLLCVLDFKIPASLIQNSIVFKGLPSNDFEYIKSNSMGLLKNYLENIYLKSTQDCNFVMNNGKDLNCWSIRSKTSNSSRAQTPKMGEVRKKVGRLEKKLSPKVPKCSSGVKITQERIKRSESNSRCHSKEHSGVFITSESRRKSPVIGIEVNNTSGKPKNLVLYIKI